MYRPYVLAHIYHADGLLLLLLQAFHRYWVYILLHLAAEDLLVGIRLLLLASVPHRPALVRSLGR
jgi:hypothetical protein